LVGLRTRRNEVRASLMQETRAVEPGAGVSCSGGASEEASSAWLWLSGRSRRNVGHEPVTMGAHIDERAALAPHVGKACR
jgi:hypothetical protein